MYSQILKWISWSFQNIISLQKAVKLNCVFFFIPEWIINWKLFFWQNFRAHRAPAYFFFQCTALITAPVIFHISRMFHWFFTNIIHMHRQIIKARPILRPKLSPSYTDAKDLGRFGNPASYGRLHNFSSRTFHITPSFSANFAANWTWI